MKLNVFKESLLNILRHLCLLFNPLRAGMLTKIDYVGALRAQRAPLPSGFSHPYSFQAPFTCDMSF